MKKTSGKGMKHFIMVVEGSGSCCDHGFGNQMSEMFTAEDWDDAVARASDTWNENDGDNDISKLTLAEIKEAREFETNPGESAEDKKLRLLQERLERVETELRQKSGALDGLIGGLSKATGINLKKELAKPATPLGLEGTASLEDVVANIFTEAVRKAKDGK